MGKHPFSRSLVGCSQVLCELVTDVIFNYMGRPTKSQAKKNVLMEQYYLMSHLIQEQWIGDGGRTKEVNKQNDGM